MRNPAIDYALNDAGEAILSVPRRKDRFGKIMGVLVRAPEVRTVQLDEVGTFVWQLCDGTRTVEAIVKRTSEEYKMSRREVEISVTTYLQMLTERRFVGFVQKAGKST